MKDSYEQRIQNQFGAFCVKVLKNEARHIQREYARLRDQEKSLGELTASDLEQTAVWDKHFMDEYIFDVQGLPVVVNGNILSDALAQLPEGKRDVILAAVNGDEDVLAAVVAHYQSYIRALATSPLKDDYGNTYLCVDEDMRLRLEAKLIHSIVTGFKVLPV